MIALLKTGGGGESSGRDGWDKLGRASLAVARSDFAMERFDTLAGAHGQLAGVGADVGLRHTPLSETWRRALLGRWLAGRCGRAGNLSARQRPLAATCENIRHSPSERDDG